MRRKIGHCDQTVPTLTSKSDGNIDFALTESGLTRDATAYAESSKNGLGRCWEKK